MGLTELGWDSYFEADFQVYHEKGYQPSRVVMRNRNHYFLADADGLGAGFLSGRFLHLLEGNEHTANKIPVIGDWVAVERKQDHFLIQGLVNRKTCFSRKPAISGGRKLKNGFMTGGSTVEQILAANIDLVFIVTGLDEDFSANRLERYLALAIASGAAPVFLLNKADLCANPEEKGIMVKNIVKSYPVHIISVKSEKGTDILANYLRSGKTVSFLGSSGVGKSSIINYLFGEEKQQIQDVSEYNGKGRHTTTTAELFFHSSGCMLIDTPGIRELQLWCDEKAIEDTFEDITLLIGQCNFNNCKHEKEPGCAVAMAIDAGSLSKERFSNYLKLQQEVERLNARKKKQAIYSSKVSRLHGGKSKNHSSD